MNRPTHYNRRVRLMEMVEEGIISQDKALLMCLHWMAQDDIDNMMEYNDLKEIADGDIDAPLSLMDANELNEIVKENIL
jgi:hypothetical protein